MKYIINDKTFDDIKDAVQEIVNSMDESYYDDMLNETYGEITMGELRWSASYALYNLDQVAYDCGFADYADSCSDEIEDSLINEEEEIYGVDVEYDEEDEDDE